MNCRLTLGQEDRCFLLVIGEPISRLNLSADNQDGQDEEDATLHGLDMLALIMLQENW